MKQIETDQQMAMVMNAYFVRQARKLCEADRQRNQLKVTDQMIRHTALSLMEDFLVNQRDILLAL